MFYVDGTTITLSRGDTGSINFNVSGYNFGPDDRALFTVKNGQGTVVKQEIYEVASGQFTVFFTNSDTDTLQPGNYTWDVRYVVNPLYDEEHMIYDGDHVKTPMEPQPLIILNTVGEI